MQNNSTTLDAEYIISARKTWTDEEKILITEAVDFAIKKHGNQKRNSGEPYVNHVIEVGKILTIFDMDANTIAAGILHDTIEDTETTKTELEKEFNVEIAFLIDGVSKLGKLRYHGLERHVESLRKFFIAMSQDVKVVIIKLADRLHNIKTLEFIPEEKQHRIALETLEIHARLADRLGMSVLKSELETFAFPYAYPEQYQKVKKIVEEETKPSEDRIKEIKENIEFILDADGIKTVKIDSRIKNLYSLYQKLKKYNFNLSKIHDIVALRVIVENMEDCYKALGTIHTEYRPVPGRIKDYIAIPKSNGYQSLHTTIFTKEKDGSTAEVQIRTREMHYEAEYGVASHLHYKEVGKNKNKEEIQKQIAKKTKWTKRLLEMQKDTENVEEYLTTLKTDFFENRVFVFTPKGDVIDLPDGASVIDFAYAIHTDIGNRMQSAKINGKMVSIETVLKQGDIVQIVVNKNQKPSKKWQEHCKTSFAKKEISRFLEGK